MPDCFFSDTLTGITSGRYGLIIKKLQC